ncbi:hypothetical protein ACN4EK_09840 [Pantanalinema rosaneae CENA516]|uniref:hypothetical protein n=1 Tax=Pantanalinema rosaneae TaxID=1620701 RepID=UPI003D6E55C3
MFNVKGNTFYRAIGLHCKLGATNHPHADPYRGQECRIIAVRLMSSSEPMLVVQFADGSQLSGLFFCELEDARGKQLQRRDFEKPLQPSTLCA